MTNVSPEVSFQDFVSIFHLQTNHAVCARAWQRLPKLHETFWNHRFCLKQTCRWRWLSFALWIHSLDQKWKPGPKVYSNSAETQLLRPGFFPVFSLRWSRNWSVQDDPERDRRCDVCSSQRSVSKAQPETIHSFWAFYGILICGWMAMIAVGLIVGIKGMIRRQLCNTCCDSLVLRVFDFKPTSRVTPW